MANLLPGYGVLRASGPDADAFLHAQLASDVRALTPGAWQWSCYLTPQGRTQSVFVLFRAAASEFLLAAFGVPAISLRGRLGDRVFKTYGDKIVITRVPRFDGYIPSAAQRDRRDRMRAATAFARAIYADPAAKAIYVAAARQLGRQPFRLAVSDFLRDRPRVTLQTTTTREGQGGESILKPESQEPIPGVSRLPDSRRVSRGGAEPRRR